MIDTIVNQVTSGRWLMTVAAAIILVHVAWACPDKVDKVIDICKDIVIFYFVVKQTTAPNTVSTSTVSTTTIDPVKPTEVK